MKQIQLFKGLLLSLLPLIILTSGCALDPATKTYLNQEVGQAYYQRGVTYVDAGQLEAAMADFSAAISLQPDMADAYFYRSLIHVAFDEPEQALLDLEQYLKLTPEGADRLVALALLAELKASLEIEETEETEEETEEMVASETGETEVSSKTASETALTETPPSETDQKGAVAHFDQGTKYQSEGQFELALAEYKQAITLDPTYVNAYVNLGTIYYSQQDYDLAKSTYEKALQLSPDDADIVYNIGTIYLQQFFATQPPDETQLRQAIAQFETAMSLDPNLAEPYYGLGVAHHYLGNTEAAIQAFETFLALYDGADIQSVDSATQFLQALKTGQSD